MPALFQRPFTELVFGAADVHLATHAAGEVQLCTLLSIKTGGCPEDCGYCSQSASAESGVKATKLMDVRSVLQSAAQAKDAGSPRFCMGAARSAEQTSAHQSLMRDSYAVSCSQKKKHVNHTSSQHN